MSILDSYPKYSWNRGFEALNLEIFGFLGLFGRDFGISYKILQVSFWGLKSLTESDFLIYTAKKEESRL